MHFPILRALLPLKSFVTWSDLYNAGGTSTPPVNPPAAPGTPGSGDMTKVVYDTNNNGVVDTCDSLAWAKLTGVPSSFTPSTHAPSHLDNGSDPIAVATTSRTGLAPKLSGSATTYLDGTGTFSTPTGGGGGGDMTKAVYDTNNNGVVDTCDALAYSKLTGTPSTFTPAAHATTHQSGGSDGIALDTLAAPTDITTLNVSTSAHGLCPKAPNDITKVLRGDGAFGTLGVSADAGNLATIGSDNLISVPTSAITSVRLRSFNAVGNPTFEVDQRNVGNQLTNTANGTFMLDRWLLAKTGTMVVNTQQMPFAAPDVALPGTNFRITRSWLRITLTTQEATLGASDQLILQHIVEGPNFRELSTDVHSVSLLVRSSVAGLTFGLTLKDPATATKTLTKLCTISSSATWTLIQLPNLPIWPTGNFTVAPGANGYQLYICLAAGSSVTNAANDTWQTANMNGASGQGNFAASPVNSTFDLAFCQHEPGPLCTTLIDKPFSQNYDECLRYYHKTWGYTQAIGTSTTAGLNATFRAYGTGGCNGFGMFPKPMAKVPTVNVYGSTGVLNNITDSISGSQLGITGVGGIAEKAFTQILASGNNLTAGNTYMCHYVADTGW